MTNKYKVDKQFNVHLHHKDESQETDAQKKSRENSMLVLAKYSNIGYYLLIPMLAGVGIGYWVDSYFNTSPKGIVFFIFLGFASTIYNLIKITKEP